MFLSKKIVNYFITTPNFSITAAIQRSIKDGCLKHHFLHKEQCAALHTVNRASMGLLSVCSPPGVQLRHKSKHGPHGGKGEDSDSDDELRLEKGQDFKDRRFSLPSLRMNAFAAACFKMSRSKADKEFYANKFRLNGKKMEKSSDILTIGDELDYIKDTGTGQENMITISRLELLDIGGFSETGTSYRVVTRVFPTLLVRRNDYE